MPRRSLLRLLHLLHLLYLVPLLGSALTGWRSTSTSGVAGISIGAPSSGFHNQAGGWAEGQKSALRDRDMEQDH